MEFERDVIAKSVMWEESVNRGLAIFINTGIEVVAQTLLIARGIIQLLDKLLVSL